MTPKWWERHDLNPMVNSVKSHLKNTNPRNKKPVASFQRFSGRFHTGAVCYCPLECVVATVRRHSWPGCSGLGRLAFPFESLKPWKTGDMLILAGVGGVRLCHEVLIIAMISGVFIFVWFLSVGFGTLRWNLSGKCKDYLCFEISRPEERKSRGFKAESKQISPTKSRSQEEAWKSISSGDIPSKNHHPDHSQNHGLTCHWCNRFHLRFCSPKKNRHCMWAVYPSATSPS